jgi:putative aldouronate transport system permease protein
MFQNANWVGFKNFTGFFSSYYFGRLMKNTITISSLKILFGFPAPVILALFFMEFKNVHFRKLFQTISYLPNFLSWVILAGIITTIFSPTSGVVNTIIQSLGGTPVDFLSSNNHFVQILVGSAVWQSVGWGSIIYLAALTSVDVQLYESSKLDGASRVQQIWYISLPALTNLMAIQLILTMGGILNAGFEQVLMLYGPLVYQTGDIIDTFVYRSGIQELNYSYSTAVGLFKMIIGFALMMGTNSLARRLGKESVF